MSRIKYLVIAKDEGESKAVAFSTARSINGAERLAQDYANEFTGVEILLSDGYMREFGYDPGTYHRRDIAECLFCDTPESMADVDWDNVGEAA